MHLPTELNGYPVINSKIHHNGYVTIMVVNPNLVDTPREYVVATWWPDLNSHWEWGHYFHCGRIPTPRSIAEAKVKADKDFLETILHNEKR